MILRFTDKEVDLLKEALSVYTQTLSERARLLCTGYDAAEGITLCCRRLEAEALAADLCHRQPRVFVVDGAKPQVAISATRPGSRPGRAA